MHDCLLGPLSTRRPCGKNSEAALHWEREGLLIRVHDRINSLYLEGTVTLTSKLGRYMIENVIWPLVMDQVFVWDGVWTGGMGRHDERDVLGTWVRTLSNNFGEVWYHIFYTNLTQARAGSHGTILYRGFDDGRRSLGNWNSKGSDKDLPRVISQGVERTQQVWGPVEDKLRQSLSRSFSWWDSLTCL